jgi:predicted aspartyl protease
MGKVVSKVKLTNYDDLVLLRRGIKSQEEVRQIEIDALIDTGATMLSLPQDLVEKLGLFVPDKVLVGQIPLEEMDLVVDPKNGKVSPRPESPDIPLIEMY